jgi:predicted TIM-barrel fold metal-dependent hydrolase
MLKHPITGAKLEPDKNKYFSDVFTDPANYIYLLDKFPNLKINLAHFGGFDEWEKYLTTTVNPEGEITWYEKVKQLIEFYPNIYTDISYTMYNVVLFNLLKLNIQNWTYKNKILFGSDYYMIEPKESEKQFYINIRAFLGEELFTQIAQTNPVQFLRTI